MNDMHRSELGLWLLAALMLALAGATAVVRHATVSRTPCPCASDV